MQEIQNDNCVRHITATDVRCYSVAIDKESDKLGKPKKGSKQRSNDGPKYKDIPLTNMRETIAKRLSFSKQTIPHYYLTSEIKMDELLKLVVHLFSFLL